MKRAVEMRRGEKNLTMGKNGGVKRIKLVAEMNGCAQIREMTSFTAWGAIAAKTN